MVTMGRKKKSVWKWNKFKGIQIFYTSLKVDMETAMRNFLNIII